MYLYIFSVCLYFCSSYEKTKKIIISLHRNDELVKKEHRSQRGWKTLELLKKKKKAKV